MSKTKAKTKVMADVDPDVVDSVLLDFFKSQPVQFPELCVLITMACGFPATIYWGKYNFVHGRGKGECYQVMRWGESPGRGVEFWRWYFCERPQWFRKPENAAVAFVQAWRDWVVAGKDLD